MESSNQSRNSSKLPKLPPTFPELVGVSLKRPQPKSLETSLITKLIEGINPNIYDDFSGDDVVMWIEQHYRIPETPDHRIVLADYHKACLRAALTADENGHFPYSIIVWSDIKKSIKSSITAAVALWRAFNVPYGSIKIIANDLKQADSRVAYYIRRAIQLNPAMQDIVRVKPSGYTIDFPNGSRIEAIPIDPKGEAGGNDDMIVFCLDDQTQVMTKNGGWKGITTLLDTDEVATQNPVTGFFEWQVPEKVFRGRYTGDMVGYKNNRLDMLVTPEHRFYGKFIKWYEPGMKDKALNRFVFAKDSGSYFYFYPKLRSDGWTCDNPPPDYFTVKDGNVYPGRDDNGGIVFTREQYVRFMAWFLSEGCTYFSHHPNETVKPEGFGIGQSQAVNPEKYLEIKQLLTDIGFKVNEWTKKESLNCYNVNFSAYLAQFGKNGDKFIPEEIKNLPIEDLKLFIETYKRGDGCDIGYGWAITTNSIRMRDDLTEISQKAGYAVADWSYVDKRWGGKTTQYTVRIIRPEGRGKDVVLYKKNRFVVPYDGMVYCPSTKNGIIFVRRNGKCYWTGNSELWGAKGAIVERFWTELTVPPNKFGKSFRWVETYAGFHGESRLLENLYELGVQHGSKMPWADNFHPPLECYENKHAGLFCLWNGTPRLSWQTKEYYESEAAILTPSEFNRVHRNQFSSSEDIFVPIEWWNSCLADPFPAGLKDEPWILALDASVSGDSFAVIGVSGVNEKAETRRYAVRYANRWRPPVGGKLDFEEIEREVLRLIDLYNIIEVVYDPYQLEDFAGRLRNSLRAHTFAFNQGAPRLIADKSLQSMIRDRRILHDGNPVLTEHVNNANRKEEGDNKLRIVKRSENLKIDLCVALSMAVSRADFWQL